jgi:hypothetical protein
VDNWATNLLDYKNLVDGLVDLLEIVDEDKYTVSFIVPSGLTAA